MWHKKLITTLVFQVPTSGSLSNFAGCSQVSHKINTGRGQPRQLHPLSHQPHAGAAPDAPGPRALAGSCLHLWPPGCSGMPSWLLGLWESQTAYLLCSGGAGTGSTAPAETCFPAPCSPGWSRPGRAGASPQAGEKELHGALAEAGLGQPSSLRESGQHNPARPTRR